MHEVRVDDLPGERLREWDLRERTRPGQMERLVRALVDRTEKGVQGQVGQHQQPKS